MKRRICHIIMLVLILIIVSGCGIIPGFGSKSESDSQKGEKGSNQTSLPKVTSLEGTPLFEFIDEPELTAFADGFEQNFPVSVIVWYQDVSGGEPYMATDESTIRAVFLALSNMRVLEEAGTGHTDDYLDYYFELEDGTYIGSFTFQQGKYLSDRYGLYEVAGFDALTKALSYPEDTDGRSQPPVEPTAEPTLEPTAEPTSEPNVEVDSDDFREYTLFAYEDPEYQMEAYRTLLPQGWQAGGAISWNFASANAPVNYTLGAFSEDGEAGFLRNTAMHFVDQIYSGGDYSNDTIASPDGIPLKKQATSVEMAYEIFPQILTDAENMHITGSEDADKDGVLLQAYQQALSGEFQAAAQYGSGVSNVFCTLDAIYGTFIIDGVECEFEAYVTMGGYTLTASGSYITITSHYWSVLNTMFFYAPVGRLGKYINDMMIVAENYVDNENYLALQRDVSGQLRALLQQKQLDDWARAEEFSQYIYGQAYYNRNPSASYSSVIADRQEASSFWHERWEDTLTGKETYDLGGEGSVTVDGFYDRVYSNGSGSIIGSNNPLYEPGADYTELSPITR